MDTFNVTYDYDCDCADVCDSLGGLYNFCKKGANPMISERCSPAQRQQILLLSNISNQLEQLLNNKTNS